MTQAAERPVVVEPALPATLYDGNDVVSIPDAFPPAMTVSMNRNGKLMELGHEGRILPNGLLVVPAPAAVLVRVLGDIVVEGLEFLDDDLAVCLADRTDSFVPLEELVAYVAWLRPDLPALYTLVGAEGLPILWNFGLALTAERPAVRPLGQRGGVAPPAARIQPVGRLLEVHQWSRARTFHRVAPHIGSEVGVLGRIVGGIGRKTD